VGRVEGISLPFEGPIENYVADFQSRLKNQTNDVGIACQFTNVGNFQFSAECPYRIEVDITKPETRVRVPVVITGRNFSNVFPSSFAARDDRISVLVNGTEINIENLTGQFLSVDTISIYYKGKIESVSSKLELPPRSSKDIALSGYSQTLARAVVKNLTREVAKSESVKFGVALKYRVIDTNIEKTLFREKTYPLADIVESKL